MSASNEKDRRGAADVGSDGRRRLAPYLALTALYAAHLALIIGYGHLRFERMNILGIDSVAYYSWFHSLYFDGDLDFRNQFELMSQGGRVVAVETPTGLVRNVFSAGPAIALAPFWIAADVVARVGGWPADGLSAPYHRAAFIGISFYGFVALLLLAGFCMRHFGRWPGAGAAAMAWGTTTLLYYSNPITLMPHAVGAAAATLFLIAADSFRPPSAKSAVWAGAALGLAMLMRWQNALFALYPLVFSVERLVSARRVPGSGIDSETETQGGDSNSGGLAGAMRGELVYWLIFGAATVVAFAPQLAGWWVLYGTPVLVPQGEGFLRFLQPQLIEVLFSTRNGLITLTPAVGLALVGLGLVRRELRSRGLALGLIFLAQLYLNATVLDWHASWGFGMRRFTELAAVFAFGFGGWLALRDSRAWLRGCLGVGLIFFVWNEAYLFQYYFRLIGWRGELTFHEVVGDKFHLPASYQRRLYLDSARTHFRRGDYESALAAVEVAEEYDPLHDDVYLEQGELLEFLGRYEEARENYLKALEIKPWNPMTRWALERLEEIERGELPEERPTRAGAEITPALPREPAQNGAENP